MIGIDIGSAFIKAVDITRSRGGFAVTAVGVVDTPPDTVANGMVMDPAAVGQALRSLLKANGFKGKQAVVSVGGQSSLAVRVIDLPKMTDAELRRSMQVDIERHLPFPADRISRDYAKIVPPDAKPDEPGIEVLLAAAQLPLIEAHVNVLGRAGLSPVAIDIEPLAVARSLVNVNGEGGPRTVAIVNSGAHLTEIVIIHDGLLRFVRSTPVAGETLTNAIGQSLVIDAKQAESLKRSYGTVFPEEGVEEERSRSSKGAGPGFVPPLESEADDELTFEPPPLEGEDDLTVPGGGATSRTAHDLGAQPPQQGASKGPRGAQTPSAPQGSEEYTRQQISQAIVGPLTDLAREIRATFDYFATRKGFEVERVILAGGTCQILHLPEFMTRELGVEAVLGNPFQRMTLSAPAVSPEFFASSAPLMAVCAGLAVRDML